jgi:hypothetical protein
MARSANGAPMATTHIRRAADSPRTADDADHAAVGGPIGVALAWASIGIGGIGLMLAVDALVARVL